MRKSEELTKPADAVVVGGGVVGLAVARELARRGARVTLAEAGRLGAEASSAAGGMLAPQAEADRRDDFFELLCASREMYPAFAEALQDETGVGVELDRTGTLYLAFTAEDEEEIERRYAWQSRAGLAVERLGGAEARALEPAASPRVRAALLFPRDWQVENRLLVAALDASARKFGARVLTETPALSVRVEGGRVCGVETPRGFVSARAVVLAAGAYTSRVPVTASGSESVRTPPRPFEHPRVEPVRGQMLSFVQPAAAASFVRHVVYSPRGYLVPRRDGRLLAGSTTERVGFDCSVTAGGVHAVTSHALEIAPGVAALTLADSWAGLRPRSDDEWPVLGESAEVAGLFYATGHYRNGILLAPATGEIVADLVTRSAARLPSLSPAPFSPARFGQAFADSRGS
jgi:glycine oxidase